MMYYRKAHASLLEFLVEDQLEAIWPEYRLQIYHNQEWWLSSNTFYAMMYYGNWVLAEAEDDGEDL